MFTAGATLSPMRKSQRPSIRRIGSGNRTRVLYPGCGEPIEAVIHTVHINRRCSMDTVTISPDFQIEIPRSILDAMGLRPGQQVHVFAYENGI